MEIYTAVLSSDDSRDNHAEIAACEDGGVNIRIYDPNSEAMIVHVDDPDTLLRAISVIVEASKKKCEAAEAAETTECHKED